MLIPEGLFRLKGKMKLEGWLKYHRQIIENPLWQKDITAMHLFMTILALCDKTTGVWSGGRFQLSEYSGIKPNTCYKTLLRLCNAKMVTLTSNTRYSTISICNWKKYQNPVTLSGNNKVTTKEQQSNTQQDIRHKTLENSTNVLLAYGKPEINEMFDYWQKTTGTPVTAKVKENRNACNNLYKKYGKDRLQLLINGVAQAQNDQYAPRIANFVQLQSKIDELILWGKKNTKPTIGVVR